VGRSVDGPAEGHSAVVKARVAQVLADSLDAFTREIAIRVVLIPTWGTSVSRLQCSMSRPTAREPSRRTIRNLRMVGSGASSPSS